MIKKPFDFKIFSSVFAVTLLSLFFTSQNIYASTTLPTLSFDKQEYLTQSAFYESEGTLKPTDTTIHQSTNGDFLMNQARYSLNAKSNLISKNPITATYNNLIFSLTPQNIQSSKGRLIENGKEIDGTDNPELKNKGIIYDNAYGQGTSLGIIADNLELKKIIKLTKQTSIQDLSFIINVPKETIFNVNDKAWNQKTPLSVKDQSIKINYKDSEAYIKSAKVWDSAGHETSITLTLSKDASGNIILTKSLPQDWLKTAVFPVYTDATLIFGTEATFNAATIYVLSISALSSTKVVIVYSDVTDSDKGNAVVGTVSGTTISFGAEATFNDASTGYPSVSTLDSTHVVVVYVDDGNSSKGTSVVGTVSGTTISFGAEAIFNNASTSFTVVSALDSTHVVVVYQDSGNANKGTAAVGTVSGTTISFGAEAIFNNASTDIPYVSAIDSTHVVVVYRDTGNSDKGNSVVGTVSGTTISFGAEATFNNAYTSDLSVSAIDSTHVVVVYPGSGGNAKVGTVSGTTISFGAEATFNSDSTNYLRISTLDSTNVAVVYSDAGTATPKGNSSIGTVSGTTISFSAETTFNSILDYTPYVATLDSTHVVVAYPDQEDGTKGNTVVGTSQTPSAPNITVAPSDGDSSAGSPTGVGSNVTFTITATDAESDNYYLAICKTNAITAVNSAAPTCPGGSWAVSGSTATGVEASVNYTALIGDLGSDVWYAFVCDANASSSCSVSAQGSGNEGSPFYVEVSTVSISGTVYTDEGSTTMGSGRTVGVSINGAAAAGTTTTAGDGTYTVSGLTISANDVLTIYLDDATEKAVTVTKATGVNQTGVDLYQNDLITRCDNSCSLSNANLDTANNNGDTDIDAIYTGTTTITTASGIGLFIPASHTFAPANPVSVGGNFTNNGTFTHGSSTLTLTGTGTQTLISGGSPFYNLIQNGSGGTYTLQDALTVSNNLTITAGTLDTKSGSNYAINVAGNWSNSGTFTSRSGTVTFTATATGKTITTGGASFYSLTLNGSGGGWTLQDATTVSNVLTIANGTLNGGSVTLTLSGTTGTPFANSGTFTASTGTVAYTGNNGGGDTTIQRVDYYNLVINNASETYIFADVVVDEDMIINNNITITAGTLDASFGGPIGGPSNISVGGNWFNSGTFTNGGNLVTLTGTGSQTITSGGSSFSSFTQNGIGGTYTLQDDLTVGQVLTITAGTLDTKSGSNYAISVGSNWFNYGTFTARSGTVTLTSGTLGRTITSGGSSFYNLVINFLSNGSYILQNNLVVTNNLTIGGSTSTNGLDTKSGSNYAITVGGNWSNSSVFTPQLGTVTLNGVDQTISGTTTFYNLTKQESTNDSTNKTLTFTSGTTTTITNALTLDGLDANDKLVVAASTTSTATISFTGSSTFSTTGYLDVSYNTASDSSSGITLPLAPTNSTNSGNNTGWFANSAPAITVAPSDGGSYSGAPTTVGSNVTFTTTATDADSDNYYLAICKTDAITAVNNSAPTCPGGSWAISSSTATGVQASVAYTTLVGDIGSDVWYAFVCDANASSTCSASAQGSGNNGSPFYVAAVTTSESRVGGGGSSWLILNNQKNQTPQTPQIPTPKTPVSYRYIFPRYLGLTDKGEDVSRLQELLQSLGFFPTTQVPTGYFGSITKDSVKKFQKAFGILTTGNVGPLTKKVLNGE